MVSATYNFIGWGEPCSAFLPPLAMDEPETTVAEEDKMWVTGRDVRNIYKGRIDEGVFTAVYQVITLQFSLRR